ncbi:MAG: DNA mismatch repair protein MutS [Anaerolineaceae bacterium]|nr:DNA mismatch repair protein MutS [Anaerolineaceae bacterium]
MSSENITPIRKQYLEIKKEFPDAIVFFRLGDFYETFDQDAKVTSKELDIVLTSRNVAKGQRIPMAGIPFHAADSYISKLINKGFHIAICEQIGNQPQNGLFPRKVVRVVTPGTLIESGLIKNEINNYLVSIVTDSNKAGFAYLDMSTGEFSVTEIPLDNSFNKLNAEISRLHPSEIILPESSALLIDNKYFITRLPDWKYEIGRCEQFLLNHFKVSSINGFGLENKPFAISASGSILNYVKESEPASLNLFNDLKVYSLEDFMILDDSTRRNLELTETIRGGNEKGSLLQIIDKTTTPMGKRLIRNWINQPLIDPININNRLHAVSYFYNNGLLRAEIFSILRSISDMERIINRIVSNHAQPRDLIALRFSLSHIPKIAELIKQCNGLITQLTNPLSFCKEEYKLLQESIVDEPPATIQHTGVIRPGYSNELDNILSATKNSREWIANLESSERARTGIKTLKVGYNKVYGYFIEITKSFLNQVSPEYIRKQTLVNAERFITPELKEYETLVLNAEERIREVENKLYQDICQILSNSAEKILQTSRFIATLDVIVSFAQIAMENKYIRPEIFIDKRMLIKDGRHPVVERTQNQISFVPNDTNFNNDEIIHIITGPNMSGKSTYLRQVALITLMAQIGCFVPAVNAEIGIVDRIFTRIGAQDEIHAGQSTFMVEMTEMANILHNATENSLLVLDEVGRGTSTYDGLSIAWAVLEYIHNHPNLRAKTLFATHYHELTKLPEILPKIRNYNVAVNETGKQVVFLHKIIEGGADKSYGIHVAQLAGIPPAVIQRANYILDKLQNEAGTIEVKNVHPTEQIPLFPATHLVLEELKELDLNNLNPIDALNKLYEWQKEIKQ